MEAIVKPSMDDSRIAWAVYIQDHVYLSSPQLLESSNDTLLV